MSKFCLQQKVNIALFDFDGTITHGDMYSKFLRFSGTRVRALVINPLLAPFLLLYRSGLLSAPKMRVLASYLVFRGRRSDEIITFAKDYVEHVIPEFIREQALSRLRWHQRRGDKVVIVSASLDVYLKLWCEEQGFDLVCSELKTINGKLTGCYINGDCSGKHKVTRVQARYDLSQYAKVYAYGDTPEDFAMLSLADEAYLNWQKLPEDMPFSAIDKSLLRHPD